MSEALDTLEALFDTVWTRLEKGATEGLQVVFATVDTQGLPQARTVVLRRAIRQDAVLETYTDVQSAKVAELAAHPHAAVMCWDPALQLQIRLQTTVQVITGAQTAARWSSVPDHSRAAYGVVPAPGTVIARPDGYHKRAQHDQFAVLRCEVHAIDVVSLHLPHRRAQARRNPSTGGGDVWMTNWLAP